MTRLLTSTWFTALAGGLVYLGVTAALLSPAKFAGFKLAEAADISADDDPSWRFRNPEFDQWVAQIKEKQASLDQRQEQLQKLATRLASERQEIYALTQTVAQLQQNFDRDVIRFNAQQMDNAKRQAKLISTMSPDGAVAVLDQMGDTQAVQMLYVMKSDVVSAILDTMSKRGPAGARHAAELTLMLRQVLPTAQTNSVNTASLR
jgi:flagellar motility protein MotE (MotC chaperone)